MNETNCRREPLLLPGLKQEADGQAMPEYQPRIALHQSPNNEDLEEENMHQKDDVDAAAPATIPQPILVSSPLLTSHSSMICSSACKRFFVDAVWPGLGLLGESYLLFSIGTLQPIWTILYPDCFTTNNPQVCNKRLLDSLSFVVVLGVILGMLTMGAAATILGRRVGSITTAMCMWVGSCGMALCACFLSSSPMSLFRTFAIFLFLFGFGVGGEYPMAASSASERAMELSSPVLESEQINHCNSSLSSNSDGLMRDDEVRDSIGQGQQENRGRRVQLVFAMQGMGIFINCLVMTALLVITNQTKVVITKNEPAQNYDTASLLTIWRGIYLLGVLILGFVLISRIQYLTESKVWEDDRNQRCRDHHLVEAARIEDNGVIRQEPEAPPLVTKSEPDQTIEATHVSGLSTDLNVKQSESLLSLPPTKISSLSAPSMTMNGLRIIDDEHNGQALPECMELQRNADFESDRIHNQPWEYFLKYFGMRLVGVSLSWLLWDVAFYGNKLFQSTFLLALSGDETTLLKYSVAATLNAAVALIGYFAAAALIDHPRVGRCRLQLYGFLVTGLLFVGVGLMYNKLSDAVLITMYLGTSFFGQLGPNATTFVLPAEVFPTQWRSSCHGIAAASGKVGALIATVAFHYCSKVDLFLLSGYAAFCGCAITFWAVPETTGLDLFELDKKWRMILEGRKAEYQGDANHPRFLSQYERRQLLLHANWSSVEVEEG